MQKPTQANSTLKAQNQGHSTGPQQSAFEQQIPPKIKPVPFTNADPEPRTMMIVQSDALAAFSAVLCPERLLNIANSAEPSFNERRFFYFVRRKN